MGLKALIADFDDTIYPHRKSADVGDSVSVISSLVLKGIKVGVVSNSNHSRLENLLSKSGLDIPFLGRGNLLVGKPFPFSLWKMMGILGVSPFECGMIGDKESTDVLGAFVSGIRNICLIGKKGVVSGFLERIGCNVVEVSSFREGASVLFSEIKL